jgi:hypothetical protein
MRRLFLRGLWLAVGAVLLTGCGGATQPVRKTNQSVSARAPLPPGTAK